MKATSWGHICKLHYGKALRDYPTDPSDAQRFRVFGTNGPIGWTKEPLCSEAGIIVGRKGAYRGIHFSVEPFFVIDTAYYLQLTDPDVDLKWAYYKLLTVDINRLDVGAAIPTTNRDSFYAVPVTLPSHSIQKRIASILSAYDDLIENNRRRIQLLEESARLLYKEWFVYLRFPGHEHVKVVDGVPEGWERKPLSELTDYLSRGITPHYDDEANGIVINQKCIRNGKIDLSLARRQSKEFAPIRQVLVGDVLINSTGEGTLGRVAQVKSSIPNCSVDTHVTIVRPKEELGIHYFGMSLIALEPLFSTMGRGATNQTELSRAAIGEITILVPIYSLIRDFNEYVHPTYQQTATITIQNQKLKQARDLLLPRLINGEIEV